MDPAVVATLISTPVSVLAAAASYAAGRIQGRAAYNGPVDAVRRQHQRDAYTGFLAAANAYASQTTWNACFEEAHSAMGVDSFFEDGRDEVERYAVRVRAAVPIKPLYGAAAAVSLEGPDQVAVLANDVIQYADQVREEAKDGNRPGSAFRALLEGRQPDAGLPAHLRMTQAIDAFTAAARSHLNGTKPSHA
ncbi:hypothetical protein OHU45_18775 [Streptomyces tubercidicus]|uniref:hypothetical protein n=1 Tax=Streptomyces TaxID=1883 RepID=UPI002E0D4D6D|nr:MULTISPECIES: hypothetical protein [Streptomyces]WSK36060.1 hypothetical protein OG761_18570 [Streptomyces tubercidicus]WSX21623.1 hypothetical protein OG690_18515 [Streptomyces tubercidicus]